MFSIAYRKVFNCFFQEVNSMVKKSSEKRTKRQVKTKKTLVNKTSDKHKKNMIKEIVIVVSGIESEKIVDLLYGKQNVNEFDIAKKLKITINQARNILYKLADYGMVSFTRKKDKKNGGWYTYFWTLDTYKSLLVLKGKIKKEIKEIQQQLQSRNTKRFYHCPNCDIEMTEENALLHNFICPECGEVFQLKDNTDVVSVLDGHLEKAQKRESIVDQELVILEALEGVARERRHKAELRKAKKKRKQAAELRKKIRLEEQAKEMKNAPKKKVAKKKKTKASKKPVKKKKK